MPLAVQDGNTMNASSKPGKRAAASSAVGAEDGTNLKRIKVPFAKTLCSCKHDENSPARPARTPRQHRRLIKSSVTFAPSWRRTRRSSPIRSPKPWKIL